MADVDNDSDADLDGDGSDSDPAYSDYIDRSADELVADPLIYTAMTTDGGVTLVDLDTYPTAAAEGGEVVSDWWDGLDGVAGNEDQIDSIDVNQNADCDSRAAALGFSLTANDPADNAQDSRPDNAPKATVNDPSTDGDETAAAKGLCGDHGTIQSVIFLAAATPLPEITVQVAIRDAFHWNMLSGAEMVEAANAAGESSPGSYGRAYGDFTSDAFRRVINSWFGGGNILARGSGTLTLTHRGIDGIDHATDDDDGTNSNFEGKAGEATVRVKVSDFTGRLIPPGDGSRTIGQDFVVTAKLYRADPIPDLQMPDRSDEDE